MSNADANQRMAAGLHCQWDWKRTIAEMVRFGSPEAVARLALDEYPGCGSYDDVLRAAKYADAFRRERLARLGLPA